MSILCKLGVHKFERVVFYNGTETLGRRCRCARCGKVSE